MSVVGVFSNATAYIRSCGMRGYAQALRSDLGDRWYDWRFGIDTRQRSVDPRAPAGHPDAVDYVPIPYATLFEGLRKLPIRETSHLVDYGAGTGRVLVAAAALGVPRTTGVELRSDLASIARHNVARARRIGWTAEVICADAVDFTLPADVDLIHFYKPFMDDTLAAVLRNIEQSLSRNPRALTVLFFNHEEFQDLASKQGWIEQFDDGWALDRTRWPISWGLYRARA